MHSNRANHMCSTSETFVNQKQSQFGDFVSTLLLDILVILDSGLGCYSWLCNKTKLQCVGTFVKQVICPLRFSYQLNRAYLFRNLANLLFTDQDNDIVHHRLYMPLFML